MDEAERRRQYEAEVRALAALADTRRSEGVAVELIAREVVALRNQLKRAYRKVDRPDLVRLWERRNSCLYGDPVGPEPDELFVKYGSCDGVIAAAARPALLA